MTNYLAGAWLVIRFDGGNAGNFRIGGFPDAEAAATHGMTIVDGLRSVYASHVLTADVFDTYQDMARADRDLELAVRYRSIP